MLKLKTIFKFRCIIEMKELYTRIADLSPEELKKLQNLELRIASYEEDMYE